MKTGRINLTKLRETISKDCLQKYTTHAARDFSLFRLAKSELKVSQVVRV